MLCFDPHQGQWGRGEEIKLFLASLKSSNRIKHKISTTNTLKHNRLTSRKGWKLFFSIDQSSFLNYSCPCPFPSMILTPEISQNLIKTKNKQTVQTLQNLKSTKNIYEQQVVVYITSGDNNGIFFLFYYCKSQRRNFLQTKSRAYTISQKENHADSDLHIFILEISPNWRHSRYTILPHEIIPN